MVVGDNVDHPGVARDQTREGDVKREKEGGLIEIGNERWILRRKKGGAKRGRRNTNQSHRKMGEKYVKEMITRILPSFTFHKDK